MSNAERIDSLKAKKKNAKATLTRFKTHLTKLPENITGRAAIELDARINDLKPILLEFKTICNDLQTLLSIPEGGDNHAEFDTQEQSQIEIGEFEDNYYNVLAAAKAITTKFEAASSIPPRAMEGIMHNSAPNVPNTEIKLPNISIKPFDGNIEQWGYFRDTFNALIHSNTKLRDIEKFHYLRLYLSGPASALLESFDVSANSYKSAWELLTKRFENKRLLANKHVNALFNLPTLVRESSLGLRSLLDDFSKHLRALKVLNQPTEHWDLLIIHMISSKLDNSSRREWENTKFNNEFPTIEELKAFLSNKCQLLETIHSSRVSEQNVKALEKAKLPPRSSYVASARTSACVICSTPDHSPYHCQKFLAMEVNNRIAEVKKLKLCLNCLKPGHVLKDCMSGLCRKCQKKHNTLLHIEISSQDSNTTTTHSEGIASAPSSSLTISQSHSAHSSHSNDPYIILSTALVNLILPNGSKVKARALLDSGSQSNFIRSDLCRALNLNTEKFHAQISGLSQAAASTNRRISNIKIQSLHNNFTISLSCLLLDTITNELPSIHIDKNSLNIPHNIKLADPFFDKPDKIDLLIGSSIFWNLLCVGQIISNPETPILQKTSLGWIVSGPYHIPYGQLHRHTNLHSMQQLDHAVLKFWELEDCPGQANRQSKCKSFEEEACESLFVKTTSRSEDGRFIVRIPFKSNVHKLGESKQTATNRFLSLEKKLNSQPDLKKMYAEFIQEYLSLNHMRLLEHSAEKAPNESFYMPHHAVFKSDSLTTKLRVVFDGSCKSSSGISLNDVQAVGPTIQNDLFTVLVRFRRHQFALTADISKMYRQIMIHSDHTPFQRILWRDSSTNEPIRTYELQTVTYGTASAAFLAIRSLCQVAYDHLAENPNAANAILKDFYVDDFLSGADSIDDTLKLANDVAEILKSGCFELRKWCSNSSIILKHLSEQSSELHFINNNEASKTLGLTWKPLEDTFNFAYKEINAPSNNIASKRTILSKASQIFDPIGLVTPIVVTAKLILQQLWQLKLSWDEAVPLSLHTKWIKFQESLSDIEKIAIPRCVLIPNPVVIELHGFSDASQLAYGACLYIRCIDQNEGIRCNLLCAKSRVAPLKPVTIPRLELCAALLLAQLINKALSILEIDIASVYCWSDSQIVISWVLSHPGKFKQFVRNRIEEIQLLVPSGRWRHVPGEINPADLLSRGVSAKRLVQCTEWWHGPSFLRLAGIPWPEITYSESLALDTIPPSLSEINPAAVQTHLATRQELNFEPMNKISDFHKLLRVTAYCIRFANNASSKQEKIKCSLTPAELQKAESKLVKIVQFQYFEEEIKAIHLGHKLKNNSKLLTLNPFVDQDGLLRVGGRLGKSYYEYEKKHPLILPSSCKFTELLVVAEHNKLLHAGSNVVLYSLRQRYWPIHGKSVVRKILKRCVICFKANPVSTSPIMGDLPIERVTPSAPFTISGLDYAGPILIRDRASRSPKLVKAYICLFICFACKAIHLELVGDLTSNSFICALRRFIARRGKPSKIFSDNGKNFVGAKSDIDSMHNFLKANQQGISYFLSDQGVKWSFIPPRAPHFGGIWESGVKCVKFHLKRILGNTHLTFEGMSTVLCQIEACLNSRPLYPISNDPNDLLPLTPAHFLMGRPLTSLPDPDLGHLPEARLSTYQRQQQIAQSFWKRWMSDYMSELQARQKWNVQSPNFKKGDLVLLKEDNQPPLAWPLARILAIYPGADGVVRVCDVKTVNGVFKRPSVKLCRLPLE